MVQRLFGFDVLSAVLVALALTAPAAAAEKQVPFKGTSSGVVTTVGSDPVAGIDYTRLDGQGEATHLGRFTVVGYAALDAAGVLLGAGDRLQANDDSMDRAAREQARRIEGVWLPIVTITDCQTQAVIATFPSMEIYVRGGGFVGFGAVQKSDQVGMGAWRHAGGRNYVSQYQFFGYTPAPVGAPDGAPDGTLLKVSSTIRLNAAGTAFSSSETADLFDPAGNVLARICGHREATRLQ
jgi:hypothetical protein